MRLLKLDPRVQQMLIDGTLSNGHARALLALEDGEKQFAAAQKIVQENLSVRDVERLVKSLNRIEADNPKRKTGPDISLIYKELEERLKSIMGTKVIINRKDKNKAGAVDRIDGIAAFLMKNLCWNPSCDLGMEG